tara:strand:+ start:208 stop:420 length:213 start_codon:yes stop_codon:yes gene_type:complete
MPEKKTEAVKEEIKKDAEIVKDEVGTVVHNVANPQDETDRKARKRQPFMPIVGAILVAIILFTLYAFFAR